MMENRIYTPTIVFGELAKIGTDLHKLNSNSDNLNSISRFSAKTTGIVGRYYEFGDFHIVGCDPYKTGLEEAVLIKKSTLDDYPELEDRLITHNGLVDTSIQTEYISKLLSQNSMANPKVNVIVPIEHRRRAVGQLKANKVDVVNIYTSHEEYVLDPEINKAERKIRIEEVKDAYFNLGMYLDIMREFGLNLIGKVDNKGLIIREISTYFRSK